LSGSAPLSGICAPFLNSRAAAPYLARLEEAVYVLHAFEKKTRKTPRRDLELASARLAELMQQRQAKRKGDNA